MSKLDDLLWPWRGRVAFLEDMRYGKFDPKKAKLVKAAVQETIDKILESNIEEKWEIANLCEIAYYISFVEVKNEYERKPDKSLEKFYGDIFGMLSKLYPEEMNL